MIRSVMDEKEDVTCDDRAKELWENHLKDGYGNLPSRDPYNKVVDSVEMEENINEKEIIRIKFYSYEQEVEKFPKSFDVYSAFEVQSIDDIDKNERPRILDDVEEIDCEKCSGSGSYCDNCNNDGEVSCSEPDCTNGNIELDCNNCGYKNKVKVDCPECDGSGYSVEHQCNKCNGTERYYDQEKGRKVKCNVCDHGVYKEVCNNCNGSGNIKENCHKCNGSGKIRKGQCKTCSQFVETSKGYVPCNECNGGSVDIVCDECEGEQRIKKSTFIKIMEKTKVVEIEHKDIFESGRFDKRDDDPYDELEYENVLNEKYDSLEEFEFRRNDLVDEDLPDNLMDGIKSDNINEIEYEYNQTQKIQSYIYQNAYKVRTYKSDNKGIFNDKTHFLRKNSKYGTKRIRIDLIDGDVVSSTDTSYLGYASDWKLELINMSSRLHITLLDRKSQIKMFLPAVFLRIIRSPWSSFKSGLITYAITGLLLPVYVYYPMLSLYSIFTYPINEPIIFITLSVIIFSYINMRHKFNIFN